MALFVELVEEVQTGSLDQHHPKSKHVGDLRLVLVFGVKEELDLLGGEVDVLLEGAEGEGVGVCGVGQQEGVA
jgi:hypothetical protein